MGFRIWVSDRLYDFARLLGSRAYADEGLRQADAGSLYAECERDLRETAIRLALDMGIHDDVHILIEDARVIAEFIGGGKPDQLGDENV